MPYEFVNTPIERMNVDAIVNPTNMFMQFSDGLSARLAECAGPAMQQDCTKLAPLHADEILITQGYNLPAKWVFHVLVPQWIEQGEEAISLCYARILQDAVTQRIQSVAMPLLCCEQVGFPEERSRQLATEVIEAFLQKHPTLHIYIANEQTPSA